LLKGGQGKLESEMRGRNDAGQSKRPIVLCCMMIVCLCLLLLYFSGSNGQAKSTAFEYGTKFSRTLGWGSDDGEDGSEESIFGTGDADDIKPKSFPVSFQLVINHFLLWIVFLSTRDFNCLFSSVLRCVMTGTLS